MDNCRCVYSERKLADEAGYRPTLLLPPHPRLPLGRMAGPTSEQINRAHSADQIGRTLFGII